MSVQSIATFKALPLQKRQEESKRIADKYPDRIPVIVEKALKSDLPDIDRMKFLVPSDLTFGQMQYVIRKRLKLPAEKAIFCFVNKQLPASSLLVSTVYKDSKAQDGFLYVSYRAENTFGTIIGFTKKPSES